MTPGAQTRSPKLGQNGQALAEFVLTLPVILLLALGTAQIVALGLSSLFLRNAAQCAARTYTVRVGLDEKNALYFAERAAAQSLVWVEPRISPRVTIERGDPPFKNGRFSIATTHIFKGSGPLIHKVIVEAEVRLFFPLPKSLRQITLRSTATTYSEATKEQESTL